MAECLEQTAVSPSEVTRGISSADSAIDVCMLEAGGERGRGGGWTAPLMCACWTQGERGGEVAGGVMSVS